MENDEHPESITHYSQFKARNALIHFLCKNSFFLLDLLYNQQLEDVHYVIMYDMYLKYVIRFDDLHNSPLAILRRRRPACDHLSFWIRDHFSLNHHLLPSVELMLDHFKIRNLPVDYFANPHILLRNITVNFLFQNSEFLQKAVKIQILEQHHRLTIKDLAEDYYNVKRNNLLKIRFERYIEDLLFDRQIRIYTFIVLNRSGPSEEEMIDYFARHCYHANFLASNIPISTHFAQFLFHNSPALSSMCMQSNILQKLENVIKYSCHTRYNNLNLLTATLLQLRQNGLIPNAKSHRELCIQFDREIIYN
jgi:hypothetical protein